MKTTVHQLPRTNNTNENRKTKQEKRKEKKQNTAYIGSEIHDKN